MSQSDNTPSSYEKAPGTYILTNVILISTALSYFICYIPTFFDKNNDALFYDLQTGNVEHEYSIRFLQHTCLLSIGVTLPFFIDYLLNFYFDKCTSIPQCGLILSSLVPCCCIYFQTLSSTPIATGQLVCGIFTREMMFISSIVAYDSSNGAILTTKSRIPLVIVSFSYQIVVILLIYTCFQYLGAVALQVVNFFSALGVITVFLSCFHRIYMMYKSKSEKVDNFVLLYILNLCVNFAVKYLVYFIGSIDAGEIQGAHTLINLTSVAVILIAHNRVRKLDVVLLKHTLNQKSHFVRYISHEVRTPLNTVYMGLQFLTEHLKQQQKLSPATGNGGVKTDAQVFELLNDVNVSCQIAIDILNTLLTYDKLDAGDLKLDCKQVNARSLILDVITPFSIQALHSKVALNFRGEENIPSSFNDEVIEVDINKFSQVLRNLISNAIKFTPAGGKVDVKVQKEECGDSWFQNSRIKYMLRIDVIDTGPGISKEDQKKLFKQAIQFNPTELQNGNGSGLGLWISKSIMDLHNGDLSVYSDGVPGQGSTFTIKLPVRDTSNKSVFQYVGSRITPDKVSGRSQRAVASQSQSQNQLLTNSTHIQLTDDLEANRANALELETKGESKCDNNIVFHGKKKFARCLVVDDVLLNRKMLGKLLSEYFEDIIQCENGLQAVQCVENCLKDAISIDFIFMDSVMPEMDGTEASKRIRALGVQTPIVGVTGNGLPEQIEDFLKSGANAVLIKPIGIPDILNCINNIMVSSTAITTDILYDDKPMSLASVSVH